MAVGGPQDHVELGNNPLWTDRAYRLMESLLNHQTPCSWAKSAEFVLSKFELYFRNSLTRPCHSSGMNDASLQFHIEQNDCFGTLATVLDLVSQDLRGLLHPTWLNLPLRRIFK